MTTLLYDYVVTMRFCKSNKKKLAYQLNLSRLHQHAASQLSAQFIFAPLLSNMLSYGAESHGWPTKRQGESRCASEDPRHPPSCLSSHPAWSSLAPPVPGGGCTSEMPKSRLCSRAFPAFPRTTRWQFPISRGGSGYLQVLQS